MAEINPTAINPFNRNSQVQPATTASTSNAAANFWGEDGFSFGDILDLINPLQHVPVVGTIYRAVTGDEISTGSSILGGGLFGGLIGAGVAVVNAIIDEVTGRDFGEHVLAMFSPAEDDAETPVVLASAENRYGYGAAFGRRAQEATWSDSPSRDPATVPTTAPTMLTVATTTPASAERRYAANPAFGHRDQEATMTSPAFINDNRDPTTPAIAALETATAQVAPGGETTAPLAPRRAPIWLTAMPRAESDFTVATLRYVTPQAGLQLVQAMAGNPNVKPTPGPGEMSRVAIDRYSNQALAARFIKIEPVLFDNLY